MTAAPRPLLSVSVDRPRINHGAQALEKSFRKSPARHRANARPDVDADLDWFARQLWRAFPEAGSENELAELVAEQLTTENRPLHHRTVRNWLRGDNAPAFRYVTRVMALAGAEAVFELIEGRL